ncbi:MAG: glycogen debranching enzyme family protein [Acetobacteraceae bacterium]|nr:glycogen debranching enzyme family protein [Acetobacteraceae bacterium]
MSDLDLEAEWLEADGLGGFGSGTVGGVRTRRYHALLLTATSPPSGRVVLVNGLEAFSETVAGRVALTSHRYAPDVVYPDGYCRISAFSRHPWPSWVFSLPDGTVIEHDIFVAPDSGETVIRWRLRHGGRSRLSVRPLLSGRDYHSLHHENPAFNFAGIVQGGNTAWRPYRDLPAIGALTNGIYTAEPLWYRNFLYTAERDRGLDDTEDLPSPGRFTWELGGGEAVMVLRAGDGLNVRAAPYAAQLAVSERARRSACASPLVLAADSYIVNRGTGRTIIAGFPWFGDWGRDTFISMRGLVLSTGRFSDAAQILDAWTGAISEGMVPNRFPDSGIVAEYNSVDASLWFVIAIHDFLRTAESANYPVSASLRSRLRDAVETILTGFSTGTRHRIGVDTDGLVRAGEPGVQLTWMDAKVNGWVVTPRIGKPVEVEALWINALCIAGQWSARWSALERQARASFLTRFPNAATGGLHDVVDVDHVPGKCDGSIRPNQVLAVGGLPFPVIADELARGVVSLVERMLLTPMGLRSLAPSEPGYVPHYRGSRCERDAAYHQGTVWPWLIGPFVEGWLAVHGNTEATRTEARDRLLAPLRAHLETAGLGHVSEIADGDPPHTPGGCPFQAWSLGELIRIENLLTAQAPRSALIGDAG